MKRECASNASVTCRKQIEAGDDDADLLASDEDAGMEAEPGSASEEGAERGMEMILKGMSRKRRMTKKVKKRRRRRRRIQQRRTQRTLLPIRMIIIKMSQLPLQLQKLILRACSLRSTAPFAIARSPAPSSWPSTTDPRSTAAPVSSPPDTNGAP